MAVYQNPKDQTEYELPEDYDTETGMDRNREKAVAKGYVPLVDVQHPKTGEIYALPDTELDAAIAKGYKTPDLTKATAESKEAQKDVGGIQGIANSAKAAAAGALEGLPLNPVDEVVGAVQSPVGAIKKAADYVLPGSNAEDDDIKKYNAARGKYNDWVDEKREANPEAFYPATITSGLVTGGALAKGVQGASTVANIAKGAIGGAAEGIGAGRGEGIEDDRENIELSSLLGGAIPAVAGVVKGSKEWLKAKLGSRGDGVAAKYVGNKQALDDALEAPDNRKRIADTVRNRNLKLETKIEPHDVELAALKSEQEQVAEFRKQQGHGYQDTIEKSKEELGAAKQAATEDENFVRQRVIENKRGEIAGKENEYNQALKDLGDQREARFDELEQFPASEQAMRAARNAKRLLARRLLNIPEGMETDFVPNANRLGIDEDRNATKAVKLLDQYLPEEGMEMMTQGQLLRRLKDVSRELYKNVKIGPGQTVGNLSQGEIASVVNDAFHDAGDNVISGLTREMAEPINARNFLRKSATTKTPILKNGRESVSFSPDPTKAARGKPETQSSLKGLGYDPDIEGAVKKETQDKLQKIDVVQKRIDMLKSAKTRLEREPPKNSIEIKKLEDLKERLKNEVNSKNLKSRLAAEQEVAKIRDLEAISGRKTSAIGDTVDVLADIPPGAIGRVMRGGMGIAMDPIRQIQAYNKVRDVFNKPGLTASVRGLTLAGQTLSRATIQGLAQQHGVDANELEQTIRDGGN